jgi:predicted nucleic acid-binding protein
MKRSVFIDTGFWIALFDKRDTNHPLAASSLKSLLEKSHLYLSDFIVFETVTYLNCSIKRHDLAVSFLDKIDVSTLTILPVDEFVKTQAKELFRKYSDKALSITDCTSFVLMLQNDIRLYAGFDNHFQQMGFSDALNHM